MSNLVDHAKRELALAGNGEEFDEKVVKMVEVFASMGHSGGSAFATIELLTRLLEFKPLTELSDNPAEWNLVEMGDDKCWQSARRSDAFTYDPEFKHYYTLDEHGSLGKNTFDTVANFSLPATRTWIK